MNQDPSVDISNAAPVGADAISRRAYEIWEREGRPDGCDLRHWLQAEQEVRDQPASAIQGAGMSTAPRNTGSDVRPLQGTRAAAAANRESKRGTGAGVTADKSMTGNTNSSAAKRKPSNAPPL